MKLHCIILLFIGFACTNLEDAHPGKRNTFIKIFNGISGIEGAAIELTNDGFIILGNMPVSRDSVLTVVFTTDLQGNLKQGIKYFSGGSGRSIKKLPDNQGYIIGGEKIKLNPSATSTDNIEISSSRLLHLNNNLDFIRSVYFSDHTAATIKTDYYGEALTITDDGKIILLGSYQTSLSEPIRPFVHLYDPLTLQPEWEQYFESIARSYRNAKSIHAINGNLIWASSIAQEQQSFNFSYLSISRVSINSSFTNYSLYGQNNNISLRVNDIQPASQSLLGFGVVGTYSEPDGTLANIFFARVDANGNILTNTISFYDAVLTSALTSVASNQSQIQDNGTAITATRDGNFVLAGHFTTNSQKGNGLNDILLIKVSVNGEPIWIKTFGGTGNETVQAIRETEDGGLLICGTNIVGNVSSVFLIKTNRDGNLNM